MPTQTISMDQETMNKIIFFSEKNKTNFSKAAANLIKLGFAYSCQLDEGISKKR